MARGLRPCAWALPARPERSECDQSREPRVRRLHLPMRSLDACGARPSHALHDTRSELVAMGGELGPTQLEHAATAHMQSRGSAREAFALVPRCRVQRAVQAHARVLGARCGMLETCDECFRDRGGRAERLRRDGVQHGGVGLVPDARPYRQRQRCDAAGNRFGVQPAEIELTDFQTPDISERHLRHERRVSADWGLVWSGRTGRGSCHHSRSRDRPAESEPACDRGSQGRTARCSDRKRRHHLEELLARTESLMLRAPSVRWRLPRRPRRRLVGTVRRSP